MFSFSLAVLTADGRVRKKGEQQYEVN